MNKKFFNRQAKFSEINVVIWNKIPWKMVENYVYELQTRIYHASLKKEHEKKQRLQKFLTQSLYARLLAVRQVTNEINEKKKLEHFFYVEEFHDFFYEKNHPVQSNKNTILPLLYDTVYNTNEYISKPFDCFLSKSNLKVSIQRIEILIENAIKKNQKFYFNLKSNFTTPSQIFSLRSTLKKKNLIDYISSENHFEKMSEALFFDYFAIALKICQRANFSLSKKALFVEKYMKSYKVDNSLPMFFENQQSQVINGSDVCYPNQSNQNWFKCEAIFLENIHFQSNRIASAFTTQLFSAEQNQYATPAFNSFSQSFEGKFQNFLTSEVPQNLVGLLRCAEHSSARRRDGFFLEINRTNKKKIDDSQKLEIVKTLQLDGKIEPNSEKCFEPFLTFEKNFLIFSRIKDLSKQVLVKMALEPEWEAYFSGNNYGFRPGRSYHDVSENLFCILSQNQLQHILKVNVEEHLKKIKPYMILSKLNTYPELQLQIQAWLEINIFEKFLYCQKSIEPNKIQSLIHCSITPLLLNIAFHDLEKYLYQCLIKDSVKFDFSKSCLINSSDCFKANSFGLFPSKSTIEVSIQNIESVDKQSQFRWCFFKSTQLVFIQYGASFVLIHPKLSVLKEIKKQMFQWFQLLFIDVNLSNFNFISTFKGFNFGGFHIIQVCTQGKWKTKITPSKQSQQDLLNFVKTTVQSTKGCATYVLINRLTPKLLKWGYYFSISECQSTFKKLDYLIFLKVRAWVFRRHGKWGRKKIKKKYFPEKKIWFFNNRIHKDNWVLYDSYRTSNGIKKERYLIHLAWITRKKHVKVLGSKSPYDGDVNYWSFRLKNSTTFDSRAELRSAQRINPTKF